MNDDHDHLSYIMHFNEYPARSWNRRIFGPIRSQLQRAALLLLVFHDDSFLLES